MHDFDKLDFEEWRNNPITEIFLNVIEKEIQIEEQNYGIIDTEEALKEYGKLKKQQGLVAGLKRVFEIIKTIGE